MIAINAGFQKRFRGSVKKEAQRGCAYIHSDVTDAVLTNTQRPFLWALLLEKFGGKYLKGRKGQIVI